MTLCSAKKRSFERWCRACLVVPACLVLAGFLLSGCADTTESLTWWSDTEDNEPVPGEDEDFPNLGSVPDAPEEITSIEVIEEVEQSLLADSAHAEYLTGTFNRVDDETSIEPMPEVVVEEVVEEEVVDEEEVVVEETADGETIEEVIDEEEVIIDEEEVVVDETPSTAAMETEEVTVAVPETTTEEVVAVEAPVEEEVIEADVVEEPEPETVVMETTVVTPAPEIMEPVGSADDALPPQAVTQAVAVTDIVEEPAAMAETETVIVEAPAPAPQSGMSQTFDTLFAASGPDAAEGGENPVPEFVEADVATVETPAPTITPTGYQTLVAVIRFNLGSTTLDDNDREIIQSIADAHRQRGGHIRLAGFASKDSEGSGDTEEMLENFNLSVDRATAVADELVRQGVPSEAVVIDAQGDSALGGLAQAQSSAAEQRRVDVYFTN